MPNDSFPLLKSARPMTSFLFLTVQKLKATELCFLFSVPFCQTAMNKAFKNHTTYLCMDSFGGLSHCIVWKVCVRFRASRHTQLQANYLQKYGFQFHKRVIVRPPHSLVNKYLFFSDCAAWILEHI